MDDDLPGGRGQLDPKVIRLSHQYASCPSCQLILPLYNDSDAAAGHHGGADGRDGVLPLQVARCGLCKRPVDTATPWPLDLKLRWCTERCRLVVAFWLALASAAIVCGRLIRRAWTDYRWDGRPRRRP